MKLQLLLLTASILTATKSHPQVFANLVTSLSPLPNPPASAYTASSWARLQQFSRHLTNTTNNTAVPCSTPGSTDQDLARDLQGVAVFGEVLIIFTVLTIAVGEGLAWRKKRGTSGEDTDTVGIEL